VKQRRGPGERDERVLGERGSEQQMDMRMGLGFSYPFRTLLLLGLWAGFFGLKSPFVGWAHLFLLWGKISTAPLAFFFG